MTLLFECPFYTLAASNRNPLDLIERDLVAGPVVELRRARTLMRSHRLRVFERAAGLEIGRNAGRAEGMTADLGLEAGIDRAPADHAPGVDPVHRDCG